MSLFKLIANETDLNTEKSNILRVLEKELSITLKSQRRQNEVVAKLLGAKDWNTLIGVVKNNQADNNVAPVKVGGLVTQYLRRRFNIEADFIISELCEEMDECVMDCHGTSQKVSDEINNQGLDVQLDSLINPNIPVLTSHTLKHLLSEGVWDVIKEVSGVTPEDVASYIDDPYFDYGLCTTCGHVRQSGGFCQDVNCSKHLVNDCGEKRLTVKMVARPDHNTYDEFEFDAADYFYSIRQRKDGIAAKVMSDLSGSYVAASSATDYVIYELERDELTLSKAKDFFLRDLHHDGFSCEIIERDNMNAIMKAG